MFSTAMLRVLTPLIKSCASHRHRMRRLGLQLCTLMLQLAHQSRLVCHIAESTGVLQNCQTDQHCLRIQGKTPMFGFVRNETAHGIENTSAYAGKDTSNSSTYTMRSSELLWKPLCQPTEAQRASSVQDCDTCSALIAVLLGGCSLGSIC